MPVHVEKRGKKHVVVEPGGGKVKKGRSHGTRKEAVAQAQAININMMRSGKLKVKGGKPAIARKPAPKRKKK
jgi:hypothetical protein